MAARTNVMVTRGLVSYRQGEHSWLDHYLPQNCVSQMTWSKKTDETAPARSPLPPVKYKTFQIHIPQEFLERFNVRHFVFVQPSGAAS